MKTTATSVSEDFRLLRQSCEREGLLSSTPWETWSTVALVFLGFGIGGAIHLTHPWLAFFAASAGGITLVWWIHDAGHDAYFASRKNSKAVIEFLGILFLGMPQIEYHFEIHRLHHGWTNVIGRDGALDTGPIVWDGKMLNDEKPRPLFLQHWLWFVMVLPLTWPLINLRCIRTLIARRSVLRLTLLAARWALVIWALHFDWAFILGPVLMTGFVLGFSASLNHFHMPMAEAPLAPFPENVFRTTQNISERSRTVTWLTGGLNFHIEHHLFPSMPSSKLRRVAPRVEAFAREHGLPYSVCSVPEATGRVMRKLKNPRVPAREPGARYG